MCWSEKLRRMKRGLSDVKYWFGVANWEGAKKTFAEGSDPDLKRV